MRAWIDAVLSVLLAPSCAVCMEPLDQPTQGPVCRSCWASILPLTPPLCDVCGDPLPTWKPSDAPPPLCARCRRFSRAVDKGRAIGNYDGALRAIVHALKYDGRRSLARPLAALMRRSGTEVLDAAHYAVPVPLHGSRRRQRGFNQADDLARHIGLPVVRALRRARATAVQADLPAAKRHENVRGAFVVNRSAATLRGQVVVLVDDVSTTGATLDACARALKDDGVAVVRALTAARVVSERR